jgi:hypothetical protein
MRSRCHPGPGEEQPAVGAIRAVAAAMTSNPPPENAAAGPEFSKSGPAA